MVRKRQKKVSGFTFFTVLIGAAILLLNAILKNTPDANWPTVFSPFLTIALVAITTLGGSILVYDHHIQQKRSRNIAALDAHNIDGMTGKEFELFLEHLLIARGYKVKDVVHSKDGGVDLVAKKDNDSYSIQAKRFKHRNNVDRRAVTDAVAGMTYRDCTKAMVITNSRFTKSARDYAEKTKCQLIDRDMLAEWVAELSPGR